MWSLRRKILFWFPLYKEPHHLVAVYIACIYVAHGYVFDSVSTLSTSMIHRTSKSSGFEITVKSADLYQHLSPYRFIYKCMTFTLVRAVWDSRSIFQRPLSCSQKLSIVNVFEEKMFHRGLLMGATTLL